MDNNNLHVNKELFKLIAQGDEQAFAEAHLLYKARLFFYGKRFMLEWYEVEDIVADAFMGLWKSRSQIQSDAHLKNFLYLSVRNKALNLLESKSKEQELLDVMRRQGIQAMETDVFGAEVIEAEMLQLLHQAVRELGPEYRRIFELSYYQEKSPVEIAHLLNINPATVRSQKRRAIQMLRAWVQKKSFLILLGAILLIVNSYFFKKICLFLAR